MAPVLFGEVPRDCALAPIRWPDGDWDCAFVPIDMLDVRGDERDCRWIREHARSVGVISLVVWKGNSSFPPQQAQRTCSRLGMELNLLGIVTVWSEYISGTLHGRISRVWSVGGVVPYEEAGIGSRGIW